MNPLSLFNSVGFLGSVNMILGFAGTRILKQIGRLGRSLGLKGESGATWILKRQASDEFALALYKDFLPRILNSPKPLTLWVPNYFRKAFLNASSYIHPEAKILSYTEAASTDTPDFILLNSGMIGSASAVLSNVIQNYGVIYEGPGYIVLESLKRNPTEVNRASTERLTNHVASIGSESAIKTIKAFGHAFMVRSRTMDEGIVSEVHDEYFPWISQLEKPFKTVFDIGSQIGSFSILISDHMVPDGHVHAFEPEPGNFSLLSQNVSLNNLSQIITANHAAVSDRPGTASLSISSDNTGGNKLGVVESSSSQTVEVKTIDILDYISILNVDSIDLIKIDCEGWEYPILKRLAPKLGMVKAVIGELQMSQFGPPQKSLNLLSEAGFTYETVGNQGQLLFIARRI